MQLAAGVGCITALLNDDEFRRHELGLDWGGDVPAATPAAAPLVALPARAAKPSKAGKAARMVKWAELRAHGAPADAWLAIHGRVYDVTAWAQQHPGGDVILAYAGRDASDQYECFHVPRVRHRCALHQTPPVRYRVVLCGGCISHWCAFHQTTPVRYCDFLWGISYRDDRLRSSAQTSSSTVSRPGGRRRAPFRPCGRPFWTAPGC